jgi:hypothetical protein
MIFFSQSTNLSPIEIGHTDDVEATYLELTLAYGHKPSMFRIMDGGPAEAKAVQERFAHLRVDKTEQD